ncbi:rNA methyltransferase TrmH family [Firmicutes bacterium CAG:313]|mgnify:FL=1|jgi:RRNA methyltransferase|nr:rNA methyltransferase TrmH family [Firmicutes bacterium CAG:313]
MQNNIINITSTSNETIKYFISLNDKKTRMNAKRFIVEGYHLVNEASKTNLLEAIISTDEKELKKINNVKRYLVNDAIINKIATTKNPQNILGIVKMLDHNITNLLPIIKGNKTKLIMLDDVNDPGNLGTIIRTAAGLGYDGIIMSPNTVDLYNEKVIRSTQGVMFKIPIIKANLQEIIKLLKKEKVFCIGTALTNAKDVKHITKKDKFAICLGNEAKGISKEVLDNMDENVKIAMKNDVESLNVSIAAGIIMYEMME